MNSAKQIIETQSFKEVTFSNIAKLTKLSRPSIYKYYKFPEEILSNILMIELTEFNAQIDTTDAKNADELAQIIIQNIMNRDLMMKLFALNFSIIRDNVRDETFVELSAQIFAFKKIISDKLRAINASVTTKQVSLAQYSLLTMMSAIYPLTHDDKYHDDLMSEVNPTDHKPSYEQLLKQNVKLILNGALN